MRAASLGELGVAEIVARAYRRGVLVPAFNAAYLPMVEAVAGALEGQGSFGLIEVARPDIERFGAESYGAVAREFGRAANRAYARLHQDHVPVVDEEGRRVEWRPLIEEALELGYDSVMIDGSRVSLEENIAVTRQVVELAHPGAAVEGELGAVLGHEPGPLPPYEELYRTGRGFTDPEQAARLVGETGLDWLSVAVGNVHGAIAGAAKDARKVEARLNIGHLRALSERVGVPLVLHGGTGLARHYVSEAVRHGMTKINVATALRQPYERVLREGGGVAAAQRAAAEATMEFLREHGLEGSAERLAAEG